MLWQTGGSITQYCCLYGGCRQTKLVTWLRLDTTKVYVAFFLVTFLSVLHMVALIIEPFLYKGNTSLLFSVVVFA